MGIDLRDPDQPVGTLSGGERQSVAIARAVYFGAKVLILDEPTSALGVKQSGVVLRYIAQARDRGLGVIFITHNPHHAYPVGDRFMLLNRGQLHRRLRQGRDHPRRADQHDGRRRRARGARARARARARQPAAMTQRPGTPRRRPPRRGAPAHRRRRDRLRLAGPGPQPVDAAHPDAVRRPRRSTPSSSSAPTPCPARATTRCARSASRAATDRLARRSSTTRRSTSSSIAAPNMLHVELIEAAARGRQARLLREAGRRHARADRARRAGRARTPA